QTARGLPVNARRAGGPAPFLDMAGGKLAPNVRIALGYWGLLLACEVGACLTLANARGSSETVAVVLVTAGAALLFNDSGVIAAALLLSLVPVLRAPHAR